MNDQGAIKFSQDLVVLPLKAAKAYPIPCDEWEVLKTNCRRMSNEPWFFHSAGFLLLGSAMATLVSILVGTYSLPTQSLALHSAWAVVAVTGICGGLCLYFAKKERGVERTRASDIVTQMELIERRYEAGAL